MDSSALDAVTIFKLSAPVISIFIVLFAMAWRTYYSQADFFDVLDRPRSEATHYVKPPEVSMRKLWIPFSAVVQERDGGPILSVKSEVEHWAVHSYRQIDISAVQRHALRRQTADELRQWLEGECELKAVVHPELRRYELPLRGGKGEPHAPGQQRTAVRDTYPVCVVVTDSHYQHALITLIHLKDQLIPSTYTIASFYSDTSTLTLYRLQNIYTGDESRSNSVDCHGTGMECVICLTQRPSCVLLPCRHSTVCPDCVGQLYDCPMCRCSIVSYFNMATSSGDDR